ncbi:MAG TPA: pyridoxal-dependent decarboxylase, partial [Blastocatellia bacterium]
MADKTDGPGGGPISRLDLAADEIRRIGGDAVDLIADYYDSIRDRPVFSGVTARDVSERVDQALPEAGADFDELLDVFRDVILRFNRHNGHPRFFGYVASPGTAVTAIADMLASALNSNVTSWRSAPASTHIERLTIDWIKQILGYPADACGAFVSGGSMANFSGLAVARGVKAPAKVAQDGMRAVGQAMRIYMSEEGHHSITKAVGLLGIGQNNLRVVRVDDRFRIDIGDLTRKVEEDLRDGHLPFCVVASAGTVNTGAFDPLGEVADVARAYDLWMHVDASYGGFAVMAESARRLFDRISEADSISLDPHKWLYAPIDCGCVLYRDPAAARAAFSHDAEYTRIVEREPDESFAFWDYSPELSRRFRALKVWMMLKSVGTRALGEAVEKNIACAKRLARLVESSEDFEMLAPVELSVFCFRYIPASARRELRGASRERAEEIDRQLDELNERVMIELQRDGGAYLSNARVRGRFSLRGCVINYRTTERDMQTLLEDVRRIAERIEAERIE